MSKEITRDMLKDGMRVRCKILGEQIDDAQIEITPAGSIYICQNQCDGFESGSDMHGYHYAWLAARAGEILKYGMKREDITDLRIVGLEAAPKKPRPYITSMRTDYDEKGKARYTTYTYNDGVEMCNERIRESVTSEAESPADYAEGIAKLRREANRRAGILRRWERKFGEGS